MERTLYGFPKSVKSTLVRFVSGSIGDITWKLFVVALLTGAAIALLSTGPFGAAVGGLLLGTLLSDDVRALVGDLWHRRWASVESPL